MEQLPIQKNPKVLYLTNVPAPYTVDFYNELGRHIDLTVLFERKSSDNREKDWFTGEACSYNAVFLKGINIGKEQAFCPGVGKYINHDYDLIVIGNYSSLTGISAIRKSKRKKIPFFIHADGGIVNDESNFKYKIKRNLISSADGCFSSGKITDDYFKHYGASSETIYRYPFTSLRKADILSEPPSLREKRELREELGVPCEKLALFVGSFIERKGIDILIDAANHLSGDIKVCLLGGMASEEHLRQVNDENKQNIIFAPFASKDTVFKYMRAADVFVFPSRYDIWGLVVNEAMSQGLPVISSDKCVAAVELIENGKNGYIVESFDGKEWADKIAETVCGEELLSEMAYNCLSTVAPYTIENMSEIYADHIRAFCDRS